MAPQQFCRTWCSPSRIVAPLSATPRCRKTRLLSHFYTKTNHFDKTGSGQNIGTTQTRDEFSAQAYSLRESDGMLLNYSFPVRLSGFPRPLLASPACNGNTCVNWWARRAVRLPNGDLLTMLGNLQFEPNVSSARPGEPNLYSVASVTSSDGGRNWVFQVRKRPQSTHFRAILYYKRSFYQDRLGTNIGKAPTKRVAFHTD